MGHPSRRFGVSVIDCPKVKIFAAAWRFSARASTKPPTPLRSAEWGTLHGDFPPEMYLGLIAGTAWVWIFYEDYAYAVLVLLAAWFEVDYCGAQGEDCGASGLVGSFDYYA
jgi:hypothetical protein